VAAIHPIPLRSMTLTAEDVMRMSTRMLPDAGEYDPDLPRMNIHPDHVPAYRSITALWNLLLSSDAHEPGCDLMRMAAP